MAEDRAKKGHKGSTEEKKRETGTEAKQAENRTGQQIHKKMQPPPASRNGCLHEARNLGVLWLLFMTGISANPPAHSVKRKMNVGISACLGESWI